MLSYTVHLYGEQGLGYFLFLWSSPHYEKDKHIMIRLRNDISKKEEGWLVEAKLNLMKS